MVAQDRVGSPANGSTSFNLGDQDFLRAISQDCFENRLDLCREAVKTLRAGTIPLLPLRQSARNRRLSKLRRRARRGGPKPQLPGAEGGRPRRSAKRTDLRCTRHLPARRNLPRLWITCASHFGPSTPPKHQEGNSTVCGSRDYAAQNRAPQKQRGVRESRLRRYSKSTISNSVYACRIGSNPGRGQSNRRWRPQRLPLAKSPNPNERRLTR